MRRLINRILPRFATPSAESVRFREPQFEAREHGRAVDLDVFVPGVTPEDVDLTVDEEHLIVTARKPHVVRRNWHAANFEAVQSDYRLRIYLGAAADPRTIWGVLRDGILRIHIRRKAAAARRRLRLATVKNV